MRSFIKISILSVLLGIAGCTMEEEEGVSVASAKNSMQGDIGGITPRVMADALHKVLEADRSVYTKLIINRLAVKEKVIAASEHWREEKALVLPAQMFRASAEMIMDDEDANFSYGLLSSWPINQQNKPRTDLEREGMKYLQDNPGKNFYGNESLGGTNYYTAIYPDVAVVEACANCHNKHKDSPKTDFQNGDIMGGVIIRIPVS